jgi:hypothetical protein
VRPEGGKFGAVQRKQQPLQPLRLVLEWEVGRSCTRFEVEAVGFPEEEIVGLREEKAELAL